MNSLLVLGPIIGAGIGMAAGYGVTHQSKRIHFVESEDLDKEMESLDIEVNETETCLVCGDELDSNHVGALVRENGEYRVVCDKTSCMDTYDVEQTA